MASNVAECNGTGFDGSEHLSHLETYTDLILPNNQWTVR